MLSEIEKEELLAPLPQEKIIDGRDLLRALLIFLGFFLIFVPKIYLSSEIYYLSRDITKIKNRLDFCWTNTAFLPFSKSVFDDSILKRMKRNDGDDGVCKFCLIKTREQTFKHAKFIINFNAYGLKG